MPASGRAGGGREDVPGERGVVGWLHKQGRQLLDDSQDVLGDAVLAR